MSDEKQRKDRALRRRAKTGVQPCIAPDCITPVTSGWYCDACAEKGQRK